MRQQVETQLVDKLLVAYVGWREACWLVEDAYRSWSRAARGGAPTAFGDYAAALDAEERAADVYAGLVGQVSHLVTTDAGALPGIAA